MQVVDPGHIYDLWQLSTDVPKRLIRVKRSGGAISYSSEWSGVQTQEVMRAEIDRMKYLNSIIDCVETADATWHARMVIFMFEARARRRKQEGLNRQKPEHDDTERPRPWRMQDYADVPFNEFEIELRPIGVDGHIIV